jgi:hypothetical protein
MDLSGLRRLLTLSIAVIAPAAAAQEYGLYLACSGKVEAKGQAKDAHLDLALRRNSSLALVQRSNVLPVGDKLTLQITPSHYSMVFRAPAHGSAVFYDWIRGAMFVWNPDFQKLRVARLSVDRQTAVLEGEMLDGAENPLGRLKMRCEPKTNETVTAPKF